MTHLELISFIFCIIIFVSNVFLAIFPDINIKTSFVVFILSTIFMSVMVVADFTPMIFFMLILESYIMYKAVKKKYTLFIFPLCYLIDCLFSQLVYLFTPKLNLRTNLFDIVNCLIIFILTNLVIFILKRAVLNKYMANIDVLSFSSVLLISVLASSCVCLFLTISSLFDNTIIDKKNTYILFLFIAFSFLILLIIAFLFFNSLKKNLENKKKIEYMENLNQYTKNLEGLYNSLRQFKHDYVNIMSSLTLYMKEKQYDKMEEYFNNSIIPLQENLKQNNDSINKLMNVKILELKSILYTKVLTAINNDIEVTVDIPDTITSVNMDTVDLIRIIGIYLDNAIDACLETEYPSLNISLGTVENDTVIYISNPFIDKGLSISQMNKKGISSKGEGHGLGLFNVKEILDKYNNIFHETKIDKNTFSQLLRIS